MTSTASTVKLHVLHTHTSSIGSSLFPSSSVEVSTLGGDTQNSKPSLRIFSMRIPSCMVGDGRGRGTRGGGGGFLISTNIGGIRSVTKFNVLHVKPVRQLRREPGERGVGVILLFRMSCLSNREDRALFVSNGQWIIALPNLTKCDSVTFYLGGYSGGGGRESSEKKRKNKNICIMII